MMERSMEMKRSLETFQRQCEMFHVKLSDAQTEQLLSYYHLLIETNKVINLTAITNFEDVLIKHFLDSLALQKYVDLSSGMSLIDIGTGAGFPGIPLKIAFPDLQVTLMDSLNKRIHFLEKVVKTLKLTDVNCVHARAEDLARNQEYREQFDIAISRAVSNLSTLAEYCLPFVKMHGYMISYKGSEVDDEMKAAKRAVSILGGKYQQIYRYKLPETEIDRSIVEIQKVTSTPKRFPRKAGTPLKEPL